MTPFDPTQCSLGEGPLWHPRRQELFWFDINKMRLYARGAGEQKHWQFEEHCSAAGWVDDDTLIMASETGLWRFVISDGSRERLCPLEADDPVTRSNDGRADPWGGFWIGTMGKKAEPKAGAIYRYFAGELRQLVPDVTISNAICFAPDRSCAYYTDTLTQKVMRQPLTPETGWPDGDAEVFLDLSGTALNPDGAVTDSAGNVWIAMWGSACVVCYGPDGTEKRRVEVPGKHTTCPAFGGAALEDLYVTSATQMLKDTSAPQGATFVIPNVAQGVAEPQVRL